MANNGWKIPLTSIGRTIDLSYPTNLAIVLVSLAAFAGGVWTMMMRGESFLAAALASLAWAGGVFLSWALARELDPDRWYSAFFAAAGALVAAAIYAPPELLLLFWYLITLRFINRSTGVAPGWIDVIGYCGVSIWLGMSIHWAIPLLALPALGLIEPKRFPPPIPFLLMVGIPITSFAFGHLQHWQVAWLHWPENRTEIWILTVLVLTAAPVIHAYRVTRSVADRIDRPLEPRRIQWTLSWALGASVLLSVGFGISVPILAPVWAALAGTALGWGLGRLRPLVGRGSRK
ncbi:hypothetical protein KKG90_06695 [Candidatus Bipolaricaulota bacterium]|nr:hypothetical protein [Candidatus Bipolaricaulota bacterium]